MGNRSTLAGIEVLIIGSYSLKWIEISTLLFDAFVDADIPAATTCVPPLTNDIAYSVALIPIFSSSTSRAPPVSHASSFHPCCLFLSQFAQPFPPPIILTGPPRSPILHILFFPSPHNLPYSQILPLPPIFTCPPTTPATSQFGWICRRRIERVI
ncbi:hypothetical protein C1H46_002943 [Malus baccata]|uniref:Uncharacterized protein n=1 Tax=Malus baccata TaxID=106549 RepID=A0A540NLK2_MALBA|nr:hypothetical protein C1H46_002943 [Malus baccata]